MYHKEVDQQKARISRMEQEGADSHDVKKQVRTPCRNRAPPGSRWRPPVQGTRCYVPAIAPQRAILEVRSWVGR